MRPALRRTARFVPSAALALVAGLAASVLAGCTGGTISDRSYPVVSEERLAELRVRPSLKAQPAPTAEVAAEEVAAEPAEVAYAELDPVTQAPPVETPAPTTSVASADTSKAKFAVSDFRDGSWKAVQPAAPVAYSAEPGDSAPIRSAQAQPGSSQTTTRTTLDTSSVYRPNAIPGYAINANAFPTGDVASSTLLIHEVVPSSVRLGQPYTYEVHVTNVSSGTLQNVQVTQKQLQNLAINASAPAATRTSEGAIVWGLGDLAPRETKIVRVSGKAEGLGNSSSCVVVTHDAPVCITTQVVEPAIAITKSMTSEAIACDSIAIRYEIRNTGNGQAEGLRIKDQLPEGLVVDGGGIVDLDVGTLAAGQSKSFDVTAKATKPGKFESVAIASGTGGLSAQSAVSGVTIRQPILELTSKCQDRTFVGRDVAYEFTIKNSGDAVASDTTIALPIPAGTQFGRASEGGAVVGGSVNWRLGTLNPGESKTFTVNLKPSNTDSVRATATATARCANVASAVCQSSVIGIPAILVEAVDLNDPIELGAEQTYVISVTNQGTANDNNVRLVCEIPKGQTYVASSGPTTGKLEGQTLVFEPLGSIPAKGRIEYRVITKAVEQGDVRFRIKVTSDYFKEAIEEMESTNQYR